MLYQWDTGKKFHILNRDGEYYSDKKEVEKTSDGTARVNGKVVPRGQKYKTTELIPRVYSNISLVLLCDAEENSVEGKPEELAERNFKRGLENGTYVLAD